MRQKKKSEDVKLEQEKQEACVKCSKLQNGRHNSFEETEAQTKQTTLSSLKSVLKRNASHKKEKVSKNSEKLVSKDVQISGKKTKNRVQFDETRNKYFEADYVILIHEEDYDLDDYYDEGSPFDDEDDDSYDEVVVGPKICCSNPNCNNLISLTNYSEYGDANNGLVAFKYARGEDRDRFDFSSRYYDVNYEKKNQNLKKSSTNATNQCENEKCQNCNNYFDFEVNKLDTSQDFSDQVTLSPPEGYKDGGTQCSPHYGLQYHNTVNDISKECGGNRSFQSRDGENQPDFEGGKNETIQRFEENEIPAEDENKIHVLNKEETESIMQQEEKAEKPKQRFIVETITMTTVTERRIVREASESTTEDSSSQNEDSKRNGILKGGKFWKNSTEKAPAKTVNYTESVSFNEGHEENDENILFSQNIEEGDAALVAEKIDNKSSEVLDEKKETEENAASPDSTELTLTFKLGQHLLIANSLKPNSAMRQLFPSPRFLSPPPLEDTHGAEAKKTVPPKQFLVTAESLRLFEEAKKSKILGNINSEDSGQSFIAIMPPMSKNDDDVQNNKLSKTIERNTLRRSLIKYSYEYRNKRLSEKKKNEHSLEERIRQLTCNVDDDEEIAEKKSEDSADGISPRSSPQGEESKEFSPFDVKSSRGTDTASSMPNPSSISSSTYKKLTDLFSRKPNSQAVSEDMNRHVKAETIQCDLVLNSQNNGNSGANSQGARGSHMPMRKVQVDKKQFLSPLAPLTACMNAENQTLGGTHPEYSLQDIDDGLKEDKKLGTQPDVIAETPQNETSNDELAQFAQQGAGRIEKLKKRYSAADDKSDDDDDYGFNKRPLVRGIKQQFDTNEVQKPGSAGCITKPATTTSTTTTIHTSWPYYSQENPDQKLRYPPRPEDGTQYSSYNNSQEYRGYAELGNANYVEYQAVGQQRINYVNQTQQSMYSTTNTYYRCQPIRFAGTAYSELSNYQSRHPPHSPPPVRRVITTSQPNPIQSEDTRNRNADSRGFNKNGETRTYTLGTNENCSRTKIGLPDMSLRGTSQTSESVKNSDSVFHQRTVTNVHNPCLQMKFSPVNYHQGPVPTASIRFSASCSPHAVVDESNVIIEPHYSTFPPQNTVGVIRVGQGQQMIRVPVPYSTGAPVQVHLMAGRVGRCDSPQRPSSPQGVTKVPVQPYNQYLIAKGKQTAQVQSFSVPSKSTPDGAPMSEMAKTVDFEKQGKAIAEELQNRQKIALSRSLSQETKHQRSGPVTAPSNVMANQERGVPEGAVSSTVQDIPLPDIENATPEASGNAVYYTMNV